MKNIEFNKMVKESSIKLSEICKTTPLQLNTILSNKYNCNVYLKREDLQPVRSFKIRGAYNNIINLEDKDNGVVCASAGNHAQGFAMTCQYKKIKGDIFIPTSTPLQKINRIRYFGGDYCTIHIIGNIFDETLSHAYKFCEINSKQFVHPYNDIYTITGQATIGLEIVENIKPDYIICPIGGGGMISGISTYCKNKDKNIKIVGVEPENADSMKKSIERGQIVTLDTFNSFVDGAAVKKVGDLTFELCQKNVDSYITISNGKLCEDILNLYTVHGIITEPAGALSISALDKLNKEEIKGKNVVCIISGGNNDLTRYPDFINKCKVYQNLRHYYIIKFAQRPGELKNFINNIIGQEDDIIRFEYIKKTNKNFGNVLVGIETSNSENWKQINKKLVENNLDFIKINEDDLIYSYLI